MIPQAYNTPRGYKNPDHGIALRGPLSQFFSGIYLKPLGDAFAAMDVTCLRYQDDVLVLCKSLRQLNRAKQRMMAVLKERRLRLSYKNAYRSPAPQHDQDIPGPSTGAAGSRF